jgi:hypothetical protein
VADERRILLIVGLGSRDELQPVLGGKIVQLVRRARRLDQVGEDHRVVGRVDAEGLRVVDGHLRSAQVASGLRRQDHLGVGCDRQPLALGGYADEPVRRRKLSLPPGHLNRPGH